MNCPNCGNEIKGTEKFCGVCGAPVSGEQPVNYLPPNQQSQGFGANQMPQAEPMPQPNYQSGYQPNYQTKPSNGTGVASLVLGILGLLLCWGWGVGAILGIIGLVMASNSRKTLGPNGMATAGLVLSILAVVFGGIYLACEICICTSGAGAALSNPYYYYNFY